MFRVFQSAANFSPGSFANPRNEKSQESWLRDSELRSTLRSYLRRKINRFLRFLRVPPLLASSRFVSSCLVPTRDSSPRFDSTPLNLPPTSFLPFSFSLLRRPSGVFVKTRAAGFAEFFPRTSISKKIEMEMYENTWAGGGGETRQVLWMDVWKELLVCASVEKGKELYPLNVLA